MQGIGNGLVREARRRAGLTKAELAPMAGTTERRLAHLERAAASPSYDEVIGILRAIGFDLDVMLVERETQDWAQAQSCLAITPPQRHDRIVRWSATTSEMVAEFRSEPPAADAFEPLETLSVLNAHGIELIVIGGYGAVLHGSPFLTNGLDITPALTRSNVRRLEQALSSLRASHPDSVPDALAALADGHDVVRDFATRSGRLGVSFVPNGTTGFDDLARDAVRGSIHGVEIRIASLADIIRSKQAANRPKDQRVLPVLREILASRHQREQPGD